MASTVLEALQSIEKGRQNCIKNARLANLPATKNMSVYDLGNLFLQQNNTEFINPNDPEVVGYEGEHGGWTRPETWWNGEEILKDAENIELDGVTYYPRYFLLLSDSERKTTFTKTTTNKSLRYDLIVTSDGAQYTADNVIHTWDTSKDKESGLGYKTRYVIIYTKSGNINGQVNLKQFYCLEAVFGDCTWSSNYFNVIFGDGSSSGNFNAELTSVVHIGDNILSSTNNYCFSNCHSLTNVSLPTLTTINGGYCFTYCYSLTNVSLPNLTTIIGNSSFQNCNSLTNISLPNLTTITGDNSFQYCYSLTNISLPNLTTMSGYCFQNCYSLTNVSLPNLTTMRGGSCFTNCYSLTNISLPNLTTINGDYSFQNCNALTNISLPNLTTMAGYCLSGCHSLTNVSLPTLTTIIGGYSFQNCFSLTNVSLPSLKDLNSHYCFSYCYSLTKLEIPSTIHSISNLSNMFGTIKLTLKELVLPNGFAMSGLTLTYCERLTPTSLVNILTALADVTGESGTHSITLGSVNLAKLTDEEKAIATNKGWTLA